MKQLHQLVVFLALKQSDPQLQLEGYSVAKLLLQHLQQVAFSAKKVVKHLYLLYLDPTLPQALDYLGNEIKIPKDLEILFEKIKI